MKLKANKIKDKGRLRRVEKPITATRRANIHVNKVIKNRKIEGKKFPFSELYKLPKNYNEELREFRMIQQLDDFYWKVFYMLQMNKVEGDYVEFGSGGRVRSFRLAFKYNKLEPYNRKLFTFDSFEGLPEPRGIDKHPQWQKGTMAVSLKQFSKLLKECGAKVSDYVAIKGFYNKTLKGKSPKYYGIRKAAFVHIDCDLYESAMYAMKFILPAMSNGSVLSFDDWFCFNGDSKLGEQAAFRKVSKRYKKISFMDYLPFGWHGRSFVVRRDAVTR